MADHRLAHRRDGAWNGGEQTVGADVDLVVVGSERARDEVGVLVLVTGFSTGRVESDAERREVALSLLGEQRDDQGRVDTAREQHADRYVGDHPPAYRHPQGVDEGFAPLRLVPIQAVGMRFENRIPVTLFGGCAVGCDGADRGGRQLADTGIHGVRRGHHRMEREVVVQRDAIDRGVDATGAQQCRDGRCEAQPRRRLADVQGFDAEAVAGQRQLTGVGVDDREREHALEMLDAVGAPAVERLEDHLTVGGREEGVAVAREFIAQLAIVVDAAVEHQRQTQSGVDHGLCTSAGQIDDLQSPVSEGHVAVEVGTLAVGSAGGHRLGHGCDGREIGRLAAPGDLPADAAHSLPPFRWGLRAGMVPRLSAENPRVLAASATGRVDDHAARGGDPGEGRRRHVSRDVALPVGP